MKIEIVEFYKQTSKYDVTLMGTLQVYVYDIDKPFDIRGIKVKKTNAGNYFFQMPGKSVLEEDEHGIMRKVFFPFFSFTDTNEQKKLIGMILKEARKFLEEKEKTNNERNKM